MSSDVTVALSSDGVGAGRGVVSAVWRAPPPQPATTTRRRPTDSSARFESDVIWDLGGLEVGSAPRSAKGHDGVRYRTNASTDLRAGDAECKSHLTDSSPDR